VAPRAEVLCNGTIGGEEALGVPWHLLAPEIAAIEEAFRGRVTVATLDVEAQPQTPERYGVGTLPAVLFFQEGRVVDQLSRVVDRADMAAKLHILTRNSHA